MTEFHSLMLITVIHLCLTGTKRDSPLVIGTECVRCKATQNILAASGSCLHQLIEAKMDKEHEPQVNSVNSIGRQFDGITDCTEGIPVTW